MRGDLVGKMKTLDEEGKAYIEAKLCDVCKHCFYTGLPGAYACEYKGFIDLFDTCEEWELSEEFGGTDESDCRNQ